MNYANIKTHDIANGPGVRVSLYVSGCTHHCKGCFNPETWNHNYGDVFDDAVADRIITALEPDHIRGFSLLGGEPFDPKNSPEMAKLLKRIRETYPQKDIWCYTGYDYELDLLTYKVGQMEAVCEMLDCIDVLVDGRFVEELKVIDLRFRGSTNQRIIDVKKSLAADEIVEWRDKYQI